jgi:benzoyl-CoA 2,3-dioxygenase component A
VNAPVKQHLIDPEICIRCYTCEEACQIDAITHNDDNVVVDFEKCKLCMDCIAPCPTGSIDSWRIVAEPYSLDDQFGWMDLPDQQKLRAGSDGGGADEAQDDGIARLLAEAQAGAGGTATAPASASNPSINLFNLGQPATVTVQGNYRLTAENADHDVRHIILDFGNQSFPVLEGQSIGIIPPGKDKEGKDYLPRLYSISSPRDGERPNTNNLSLTVKRDENGICSNYICDLERGDKIKVTGPFGSTFLMPDDPNAKLIMVCTGTGSAPFRGFTMRRQRTIATVKGSMQLFFGARTPQSLPYFGPLGKVPEDFLAKHFAFSRVDGTPKEYVQDKLRERAGELASALQDENTHIYICGLKAMETGVESAFEDIARGAGLNWKEIRDAMREAGRYHVETY